MNHTKLPISDLALIAIALPEEVKMYHYAGDFVGEIACIDRRLSRPIPDCLRRRLEIQKLFATQLLDDYPLTRADVVDGIRARYPVADENTLDQLMEAGNVDYILKSGEMRFQHQAISNIFKTHTAELEALQNPNILQDSNAPSKPPVPTHILTMQEKGSLAYRYEVEHEIRLEPHAERPGELLRLWFPFPVMCDTQPGDEIVLTGSSHPVTITGTVHRTAFMETACEPGATYSVRFSFVNRARYVPIDLDRTEAPPAGEGLSEKDRMFYTAELYPHIRFTPFIKSVAAEIAGDETDPLRLARRVYDYICEHIRYSYVRDYLLIENIPEYVLLNGYGDCGTMALAFITLCRALGIPAKWQSGWSCYPDGIGSHDWAMFYVAPYGWLYCDPSYGEGAARAGNEARRNHYFGNLDPFRMVASNEFQQPLSPDKMLSRMDPYDNQNGEGEYADGDCNIFFDDHTRCRRVLHAEQID